jgi:hypothetical protein
MEAFDLDVFLVYSPDLNLIPTLQHSATNQITTTT